jgi:hypothetical protein
VAAVEDSGSDGPDGRSPGLLSPQILHVCVITIIIVIITTTIIIIIVIIIIIIIVTITFVNPVEGSGSQSHGPNRGSPGLLPYQRIRLPTPYQRIRQGFFPYLYVSGYVCVLVLSGLD